jgi:monoamine oxidase
MPALTETPIPTARAVPKAADLLQTPSTEPPEVAGNRDQFRHSANAAASTNGHTEDPFKLSPKFAYTPRRIKVITIGAGFSGLLMAHKFQHRFPEMQDIVDHTIFEARSDVGGTWLANHYPGVQCDVPAHIYVCFPGEIPIKGLF